MLIWWLWSLSFWLLIRFFVIRNRNRGRSIFLTFGTLWKTFFIKCGICCNYNTMLGLWSKLSSFCVWFISYEDHFLRLGRQLVYSLCWRNENISFTSEYLEVRSIWFLAISFKELYRSFPIMMTHGLSVIQMYWCLYSVLSKHFRKAGMMAHGFCLFQYGSIKSLSSTILLWHVRYGGLMSHDSGREEHLKFMTHELSSLVWTDRGKAMTSKGLCSENHILEMHLHSWLDLQEGKKSITHTVINESKHVTSVRTWLNWHGSNEVGMNQSKWAWGLFRRTRKGMIQHLPNSIAMMGWVGGQNFQKGNIRKLLMCMVQSIVRSVITMLMAYWIRIVVHKRGYRPNHWSNQWRLKPVKVIRGGWGCSLNHFLSSLAPNTGSFWSYLTVIVMVS